MKTLATKKITLIFSVFYFIFGFYFMMDVLLLKRILGNNVFNIEKLSSILQSKILYNEFYKGYDVIALLKVNSILMSVIFLVVLVILNIFIVEIIKHNKQAQKQVDSLEKP